TATPRESERVERVYEHQRHAARELVRGISSHQRRLHRRAEEALDAVQAARNDQDAPRPRVAYTGDVDGQFEPLRPLLTDQVGCDFKAPHPGPVVELLPGRLVVGREELRYL